MASDPLVATYNDLFNRGAAALRARQATTDAFLRHPATDTRFGLSLLIPVAPSVAASIAQQQAALQGLEPSLYCYPPDDMHVTWLTLLTAQAGRTYSAAEARRYAELLRPLLAKVPAFPIRFEGLSLSAGAVVAQGFPGAELQQTREAVRHAAAEHQLPLEERYHSLVAHTTIVRFSQLLQQPAAVVEYVKKRRHELLGTQLVREAHLTWNDWYNRRARSRVLARLPLSS